MFSHQLFSRTSVLVINATSNWKLLDKRDLRVPIFHRGQLGAAVRDIRAAASAKAAVAVHCKGGRHRAPTAAALLMLSEPHAQDVRSLRMCRI